MRRLSLIILLRLVCLPVWASDPGEYQDCSDWMQLQPGYNCTTFLAPPCNSTTVCEQTGQTQVVDTSGQSCQHGSKRWFGEWENTLNVCREFPFVANEIATICGSLINCQRARIPSAESGAPHSASSIRLNTRVSKTGPAGLNLCQQKTRRHSQAGWRFSSPSVFNNQYMSITLY